MTDLATPLIGLVDQKRKPAGPAVPDRPHTETLKHAPFPSRIAVEGREMPASRQTHPVSDTVFRQVYDSPASLPGRHRWVTPEHDVRQLEELLGMPSETVGAPLWVSGDRKDCPKCGREVNWLDIVSSALNRVHDAEMIARVILGEEKFINTEAPRAIAGVECFQCKTPIEELRSFKCHNWAYAKEAMLRVLEQMEGADSAP
jgi:hypothetical protein